MIIPQNDLHAASISVSEPGLFTLLFSSQALWLHCSGQYENANQALGRRYTIKIAVIPLRSQD
jgi:hypothetical protein